MKPSVTKPARPSVHVDEHLVDAALHRLSPATQALVSGHLHSCRRCRTRLSRLHESLAELSLAQPKAAPPPALRAHLLAGLDSRAEVPYAGFARRLQRMYALDEDKTRQVLHKSADPAQWEDQGFISLLHFSAGESLPGTHAGFMRLSAGLRFPRHRHVAQEHMLMLAGTLPHGATEKNIIQQMHKQLTTPMRPIEDLAPELPLPLAAMIMRALARDADERPELPVLLRSLSEYAETDSSEPLPVSVAAGLSLLQFSDTMQGTPTEGTTPASGADTAQLELPQARRRHKSEP